MYSGAMNSHRILDDECEEKLLPSGLYAALVIKAHEQKRKNASMGPLGGVVSQYRQMSDLEKGNAISLKSFRHLNGAKEEDAPESCKLKFDVLRVLDIMYI